MAMEQGGLQPADKKCMERNDQVNYSKNALQFKSIIMTRLDAKRNKACKDSKLTKLIVAIIGTWIKLELPPKILK